MVTVQYLHTVTFSMRLANKLIAVTTLVDEEPWAESLCLFLSDALINCFYYLLFFMFILLLLCYSNNTSVKSRLTWAPPVPLSAV